MAFPVIEEVTTTSVTTASTTHNISMPATVNASDLLVAIVWVVDDPGDGDQANSITTPSGWTALNAGTGNFSDRLGVFYKVASGSEDGTTVDFVSSSSCWGYGHVYRFTAGTYTGTPENAIESNFINSPNPPNLDPSGWGTEDTLWIAAAGQWGSSGGASAPTNYTDFTNTTDSTRALKSARRELNAGSENPGTFGASSSHVSTTIAVRGKTPVPVTLTGAQAAASGTIRSLQYKALAGSQAAPSGTLVAKWANKYVAGLQAAPSGALAAQRVLTHVALAGAQPAATGALRSLQYKALAGAQPAAAGALTFSRLVALAGAQGQPKGTLSAQFKGLAAAVAFDASSESHTGTTGSTSAASFSWTHTPVGSAKGVLVFVWTNANADYISTVTYGGVDVPAVSGGEASDTAGEPGRCTAFYLGSGLPQGAQTVVVNRTNNATTMYAVAATVTCIGDTEVYTPGIVLVTGDSTVAQQNVDDGSPGANSVRFAAGHFGHTTPPTAGAASTAMQSIDIGATCFVAVRETTAGQGSRAVGLSSGTSDDRAIVHLAVRGKATKVWLQGEQPAATGSLSAELNALVTVSLSGLQPAATGALALIKTLKALAGAQAAPSGALVAKWVNKYVAGAQPAATGTIAGSKQTFAALAGAQAAPAGTVAFKRTLSHFTLAGAQAAPSGALALIKTLKALAGAQAAPSGALAFKRVLTHVSLTGAQPSATGALANQRVLTHIALAGNQPAATGAVAAVSATFVDLAGSQPAAAGVLVVLVTSKHLSGDQAGSVGALVVEWLLAHIYGNQAAGSGTIAAVVPARDVGFAPVAGTAVLHGQLVAGRATQVRLGAGSGSVPGLGRGRGRIGT